MWGKRKLCLQHVWDKRHAVAKIFADLQSHQGIAGLLQGSTTMHGDTKASKAGLPVLCGLSRDVALCHIKSVGLSHKR